MSAIQHRHRMICSRDVFATYRGMCALHVYKRGTSVHHIIPLSSSGADTPDNMVVLCPECHEKVHQDWRYWVNHLYRAQQRCHDVINENIVVHPIDPNYPDED